MWRRVAGYLLRVRRHPFGTRSPARAAVRRPVDRWLALAAATAYVGLGVAVRGKPGRRERSLFDALNHDLGSRPLLRVPQQLGTPWVLPALSLAGFTTHRPHLAVAAACALPLEKGLEVGVKKTWQRSRPAEADPEAELRDDAPREGSSYPSGHTAIALTATLLLSPYLPPAVAAAAVLGAGGSAWVRVRQGAHFPVDTVGGGLLAVAVTSGLYAALGRPTRMQH